MVGVRDAHRRQDRIRRGAERIAQAVTVFTVIGLVRQREARHERVLHLARRKLDGEVRLIDEDLVVGIAHRAAAVRDERARRGARGTRPRIDAGLDAPGALRLVHERELIDLLPARQVAQREVAGEVVRHDRRQRIDTDFLRVEVRIAVVGARRHTGQRAVIEGTERVRHAVLRNVVVFLVQIGEREPRVGVTAERDGRRDSPALEALDVTARNVVLVRHQVQAEIGDIADFELRVEGQATIRVAAAGDVENSVLRAARRLRDEIDRAADRACARVDGIRAGDELELLEVERIRAAVLRAVAHAVGRDVVAGGVAAQVHAVAVTAAALTRRERDAGQRRQDFAHRQQVLLVHDLARHERDRLRSFEQRRRVTRAQSLLEPLTHHVDDFARPVLLVRLWARALLRLYRPCRKRRSTQPCSGA